MASPLRIALKCSEHKPGCTYGKCSTSWQRAHTPVSRSAGHLQQQKIYLRARRGVLHTRRRPCNAKLLVCKASLTDTLLGVGLFLTPGMLAIVYAYFKGKGNVKDGLSKLLTEVSQGYFQPDVGGENIPIAQGELSDLAGDEPLFKALYQWWVPCCTFSPCPALLTPALPWQAPR